MNKSWPKDDLTFTSIQPLALNIYYFLREITLPRFSVFITCLAMLVAGCSEKEIEVQTIPVAQSSYGVFRQGQNKGQSNGQASNEEVEQRMMVAVFDRPEATWFFKASGNEDVVTDQQDNIFKFFRGVTFEQNEPEYTLPEGWTVGKNKASAFGPKATLIIDADSKTPLTISRLGPNQNLSANANRWRGQLNLDPLTQTEVDTEFAEDDDGDFYLFDAVGTGSGKMGGKSPPFANAPFLNRMQKQAAENSAQPKRSSGSAAVSTIKYNSPAGWSEKQSSGMVSSTRFTKKNKADSTKTTLITLTKMSAAVNNWPDNAKRWAEQASQTLTDDQIAAATEKITIDGNSSQLIELVDGDTDKAIVAVMTIAGNNAWFFKLDGDKESVAKEQATFRKLLKSIKF